MDKIEKDINTCCFCFKDDEECTCEPEVKIVMTLKKEGFEKQVSGIDINSFEQAFKVYGKKDLLDIGVDNLRNHIKEYLEYIKK